jgi:hypothetical protein
MKSHLLSSGAALVLALFVSGCETDGGISARAKEKPEVYATLRPWQKTLIDSGVISNEFTPDMVYIAMGKPDKVETKDFPEGRAELWTYTHYFPNVDAIHGFRRADFSTESAYQPQRALTQTGLDTDPNSFNPGAKSYPLGMAPSSDSGNSPGSAQSLDKTGGPQGGSMEPADLRSYTIKVLFASGKVVRFGANENVH